MALRPDPPASGSWPELTHASAVRARLLARLPRLLVCVVLGVLAAVGLRALISSPESVTSAVPDSTPIAPAAAWGLAESFARAYLTWEAGEPEARDGALERLGAGALGEGAGLLPPSRGARAVRWSAVVAERPGPGGATIVTVAAAAPGEPARYLAVPVRFENGRPALAGHPALVGPPAPAPEQAPAEGDPVEDPALVGVARRAVRNYLRGDPENLLADLAPGAVLSLPGLPVRGRVGEPRWLDRPAGWIGVPVEGELAGARAELRYLLRVRHEGRWLVAELAG